MAHEASLGRRPIHSDVCELVKQSGPDVDTNPGLLPPVAGEHAEQNVPLLDAPRRTSLEVRHGHAL